MIEKEKKTHNHNLQHLLEPQLLCTDRRTDPALAQSLLRIPTRKESLQREEDRETRYEKPHKISSNQSKQNEETPEEQQRRPRSGRCA
jgi:hypothetical protein